MTKLTNVAGLFFKQYPERQATIREIAEWIVKNHSDYCHQRNDYRRSKITNEELIKKIASDISPRRLQKIGIERIKVDGKRWQYEYFLNNPTNIPSVQSSQPISTSTNIPRDDKANKETKISEEEMYPILAEFLRSELRVYSKRINEKRSSNTRGRKGNKWLHPDLVGLEDLSADWSDGIKNCVEQYSDKKTKLWSFEVKKEITPSNVREVFFQAVGNSSWANFGYLVAYKIHDRNSSFKELQTLSSLHGIGFIELNISNPSGSQIMIPAKEKMEIDWNIADRIAEQNDDYKDYILLIEEFYKTGRIKPKEWD